MISPSRRAAGAAGAPSRGSRACRCRRSRRRTAARCASRVDASRIFGQRCSATRPLRSSSPLMRACEATKRWASSASDISSVNSATGLPWSMRGVLGDVRDERRLAHRRARGEDDQVAGLEAAGDLVEVLEAGRRAGERGALDREPVELVELVVQDLVDRAEVLLAVVVGDLEHAPARPARRARAARRGARATDAWISYVVVEQPPQQRVLADDARVAGARCPRPGRRAASSSTAARRRPRSSSPVGCAAAR